MRDTKTVSYVIAPREQRGTYCGYMPLDDTRKLEIRYMPTEDIFSRVRFATEDGRPLNANPREYHFVNQLQSWICEVDIDDCAAEIEVSVASGLAGRLPLCNLLDCQQAYLTDGILLVARLRTIKPRAKVDAPPVAHTPPAQTTPSVKHQSEHSPPRGAQEQPIPATVYRRTVEGGGGKPSILAARMAHYTKSWTGEK
jgi:hypothetical protein